MTKYVKCVDNKNAPSLRRGRVYPVITENESCYTVKLNEIRSRYSSKCRFVEVDAPRETAVVAKNLDEPKTPPRIAVYTGADEVYFKKNSKYEILDETEDCLNVQLDGVGPCWWSKEDFRELTVITPLASMQHGPFQSDKDIDNNTMDMVNHPPHYTFGGIECLDAIKAQLGKDGFIAFLRGQIAKYNWRLMHKSNPLEDAKKIQFYTNKLVNELEGNHDDNNQ
jgi:hypothetical protein